MDVPTAAVVATATTAAAAYLNAKLHISKDLTTLFRIKTAERLFVKALLAKRASLWYQFEDACKQFPSVQAIWSREGCYSRTETYQRACQYANYFLSLGVKPDQMVAVYHMNSPEFMFMWLGLWAIGCAPAMINYNLAADPLIHCIKIANAKVLIVDQDEGCQARIRESASRLEKDAKVKIIVLDDILKARIAQGDASRPPDTLRDVVNHPQKPIGLIYTSGTTGLPKAFGFEVARAHPGGRQGRIAWELEPGRDVFYVCMPMYHGTGGVLSISRMMDGITLAIGKKFSATNFWKDIRDSKATAFGYVGEAARYLLAAPPSPLDKQHNVKLMHGNGLRPDVWVKFQDRFGVSEVSEFFSSTEGMFNLVSHSRSGIGSGTVGHHGVLFRTMLYNRYIPVAIDPDTGEMWRDPRTGFAQRKTYSEGGEILVRMTSQQDWPGYFNSQAATNKKIIRDVFEKGDVFYRPGDALRRDDDGFWYFMDRLGDTFRWKGENVSTTEVSEILGRHPDVHEANVYGVALPNHDGRAGCAAIEFSGAARARPNWQSLAAHAHANLPRYAVPLFIRLASGTAGDMGTHNYKQDKVPYRAEGVDPSLRGTRVPKGAQDEIYWLPPKGDAYVPFTQATWNEIVSGQLKL